MIYVSISDLIPGLHKKTSAKDSVLQVLLIIFGASIIFIIHHYVH
jgi:zinc and cadmium transporter